MYSTTKLKGFHLTIGRGLKTLEPILTKTASTQYWIPKYTRNSIRSITNYNFPSKGEMEEIEAYNKYNFLQNHMAESILDRFLKFMTWKPNEMVLDIGIGDGKFTAKYLLPKLPKDVNKVIGCDYVPWKVEFAKMKYTNPKLHFIELDIQTRDLPKNLHGTFEHVFSFFAFNWLQDMRLATENMYKMMKPGGELLVAIVERNFDSAFTALSKNPKWAPYGHEQYLSNLTQVDDWLPYWRVLLQETGFTNLNCFREYCVYKHTNREVMEGIFKAINPIIKDVRKEDLDEYCADFQAELFKTKQCCVEICTKTQEEICTSCHTLIILYATKPGLSTTYH